MKNKVVAGGLALVSVTLLVLLLCLSLSDGPKESASVQREATPGGLTLSGGPVRREAMPGEQALSDTSAPQQREDNLVSHLVLPTKHRDTPEECTKKFAAGEDEWVADWEIYFQKPTHEKLAILSTGEIEGLAARWTMLQFIEHLKTLDEKTIPEEWLRLWTALGWKLDHDPQAVAQAEEWLMSRLGQDDALAMKLINIMGKSNLPAAWDALSRIFEAAAFSSRKETWADAISRGLSEVKIHKGGTILQEATARWYRWIKLGQLRADMPLPPYRYTSWHPLTKGGERMPSSSFGFDLPPSIAERAMRWVDLISPHVFKGDRFYDSLFVKLLRLLEGGQEHLFSLTDEVRKVRRFHPGITSFFIERYRQSAATGRRCAQLYLHSLEGCSDPRARDLFLEVLRDGARQPSSHIENAARGLTYWWECQESEKLLWNMLEAPPYPEVLSCVACVLGNRFDYREAIPGSDEICLSSSLDNPRFASRAARLYKPHIDRIWKALVSHAAEYPLEVLKWLDTSGGCWLLASIYRGNIEKLPQTLFLKDLAVNHSDAGIRRYATTVLEEFQKKAVYIAGIWKGREEQEAADKARAMEALKDLKERRERKATNKTAPQVK